MQLTLLKYQGDKHLVTCLARAFGKRRSLTDNGKILPFTRRFWISDLFVTLTWVEHQGMSPMLRPARLAKQKMLDRGFGWTPGQCIEWRTAGEEDFRSDVSMKWMAGACADRPIFVAILGISPPLICTDSGQAADSSQIPSTGDTGNLPKGRGRLIFQIKRN